MDTATSEQIRELLEQGLSTADVAAALGVTPGRVAAIKAHMTMGTYDEDGRASPDTAQVTSEQVRELLAEGHSTGEVATRLGIPPMRVAAVKAHMTMGTYDAEPRKSAGIYLRRDGELIALAEQPYETEDVLQALLADHPGLLAGDELGDAPRRWLLLSREVAVGDQEGSSGRWSLDHLFADQDAIPTLVEVKRSSDTRIRREVVGQLIEYAANGTRYWPTDELRVLFEANCKARDVEPDAELQRTLGEDADIDGWWAQIETNLRLGRLRLVFVADRISRELRRIIEFLNEQMTQTEVIGVEIRQYVDSTGEHQTIVPRVIGNTETAKETKRSRPRRTATDRPSLINALADRDAQAATAAEALLDWAEEHPQLSVVWNRAADIGFGAGKSVLRIWSEGTLEAKVHTLRKLEDGWDDDERIERLLSDLEGIAGVEFNGNRGQWPRTPLSPLADPEARQAFIATIENVVNGLNLDS